ncbi:homologous-pairing protein 2 homolog isoform X1 [Ornithorhynchus anatinus]|nr:homologous-pairing protein 2 homolog isoform X1 [Ornithorhynchus anatinus]
MSRGRSDAAEAPGLLLRHLRAQNRPLSAQDACGNLQPNHGIGKTAVLKALEQLVQQGTVREKVYGKQKIYFADQGHFDTVNEADLKRLDDDIAALATRIQNVQQACRPLEAELKELTGSLTTPAMRSEIQVLKEECAGYTEKLRKIKSASNHVTPAEKDKVYSERQKYCKEWRKRKRLATEMCDAILEGYSKTKKQFYEEVGLETDEDYGVTLPPP